MNHPSVQSLELRIICSGNVTTSTVDGILTIEGDAQANQIELHGELLDRKTLTLQAIDDTNINGGPNTVIFNELFRAIVIRLGDGDDIVAVNDADIAKILRVELGAGDDTFTTARTVVRRDLVVFGETGDDHILITSTAIWSRLGIS